MLHLLKTTRYTCVNKHSESACVCMYTLRKMSKNCTFRGATACHWSSTLKGTCTLSTLKGS